jgi:signal transduction histidine kinase
MEHGHFAEKLHGLRFVETYIPVWNRDHSQVVGAVELYRVPLMLHQSIHEAQRFVWMGALIGGTLLFVTLYWIVRRAAMVMENQQRRLIEAESFSVIGQTASAITHAMRNPLSSIRACAELSLTDDLEGVRESARDIMDETDRLDRWARDFLMFSVANNEKPEHLDVNRLLKSVVKEHEPVLKRSSIFLQLVLAEEPLLVEANFIPLTQVFGNLIINAIEAMGEHGELKISTFLDALHTNVIVRIVDNGPGIPVEFMDRLFKPFATTKSTGTGLGLALSRHLVEHYHGTLDINSEAGQGVTVTVTLPVSGDRK